MDPRCGRPASAVWPPVFATPTAPRRYPGERPPISTMNSPPARGIASGGIGAVHLPARPSGRIANLERRLQLRTVHRPDHESEHGRASAYHLLAGGDGREDRELLRQDEGFRDAPGATRLPDPTTAGDFCRRGDEAAVGTLLATVHPTRRNLWALQPAAFFTRAILAADGTLVPTTGECQPGMDISYDGPWGDHPLLVSLANPQEPWFRVNRSGNRPGHEGAHVGCDKGRGQQENLRAQLQPGAHARNRPVDPLLRRWAYLVMAALAGSLQAWRAWALPETPGPWRERHQAQPSQLLGMEFTAFFTALIRVPGQILTTGRRIVYRRWSGNPGQGGVRRLVETLRRPMRCGRPVLISGYGCPAPPRPRTPKEPTSRTRIPLPTDPRPTPADRCATPALPPVVHLKLMAESSLV